MTDMGIDRKPAPELRVPHWIDGNGAKRKSALKLAELGEGHKLLYCFQSWCPGCHARGFPTLKKLVDKLSDQGVGFAAIQTVFEGEQHNTPDKLEEMQDRYGLGIPFGHDPIDGRCPTVMADYRTGGTPWFIVIDPDGLVIFNDFHLDADRLIEALSTEDLVA